MSKRQPMHPLAASDLDAETFTVVPQPDPVKVATTTAAPSDVAAQPPKNKGKRTPVNVAIPPSRVGKVQIVAWTTEDIRARLKALAAMKKRSVDDILNAAIADILKRG